MPEWAKIVRLIVIVIAFLGLATPGMIWVVSKKYHGHLRVRPGATAFIGRTES